MKDRNRIFFWILLLGVVAIDQISKFYAQRYLVDGNKIFNEWVALTLINNTGCAWGFLQGNGRFLICVGVLFCVGVFLLRRFLHIEETPILYALLCGGVVGNLLDRIFRGYVVDFIDINLQFYRWPAFNIADAAMLTAVFFLLLPHRRPYQIED